ncbi:glycine zipper family protein [Vibrio maritimus]|uniref:glycine zipper family protein n=1 Tax=Vibrio maritimus TaxID=990268 RepID=UPI001F40EDB5|nr:glycine zipper family protein [Vibrio maritimus]
MKKLSVTLVAASVFSTQAYASVEDCYATPITSAVDGAIIGGVIGAMAGDTKKGALIGAGAGVIDGEFAREECAHAVDRAEYEYEVEAEYEYEAEYGAEVEYEVESHYELETQSMDDIW